MASPEKRRAAWQGGPDRKCIRKVQSNKAKDSISDKRPQPRETALLAAYRAAFERRFGVPSAREVAR